MKDTKILFLFLIAIVLSTIGVSATTIDKNITLTTGVTEFDIDFSELNYSALYIKIDNIGEVGYDWAWFVPSRKAIILEQNQSQLVTLRYDIPRNAEPDTYTTIIKAFNSNLEYSTYNITINLEHKAVNSFSNFMNNRLFDISYYVILLGIMGIILLILLFIMVIKYLQ